MGDQETYNITQLIRQLHKDHKLSIVLNRRPCISIGRRPRRVFGRGRRIRRDEDRVRALAGASAEAWAGAEAY
jgi:hypothetical protein